MGHLQQRGNGKDGGGAVFALQVGCVTLRNALNPLSISFLGFKRIWDGNPVLSVSRVSVGLTEYNVNGGN